MARVEMKAAQVQPVFAGKILDKVVPIAIIRR
jgi:hypothetical protein